MWKAVWLSKEFYLNELVSWDEHNIKVETRARKRSYAQKTKCSRHSKERQTRPADLDGLGKGRLSYVPRFRLTIMMKYKMKS